MLPILDTNQFPVDYARLLFVDYQHVLRTISCDVPGWFRLQDTPPQTDTAVLDYILRAMTQPGVSKDRNPAVYKYCVYHLSASVFSQSAEWVRKVVQLCSLDILAEMADDEDWCEAATRACEGQEALVSKCKAVADQLALKA